MSLLISKLPALNDTLYNEPDYRQLAILRSILFSFIVNSLQSDKLSITLGPSYNEFGYYKHPVTTSNSSSQKKITSD